LHVNDDPKQVTENREILRKAANLPAPPFWLAQVHGTTVVNVGDWFNPYPLIEADAAIALAPNQVCAVLTADCLPIFLCNQKGTCVSAIHAGWRGIAAGVIEAAIQKLGVAPETLLAWLGPAIGPQAFEVKEDVLMKFPNSKAFVSTQAESWLANIYQLATERLHQLNIYRIFGGNFCTYYDPTRFYSFRRASTTGRMASLIWLTASP
jgi:YfiH family protein